MLIGLGLMLISRLNLSFCLTPCDTVVAHVWSWSTTRASYCVSLILVVFVNMALNEFPYIVQVEEFKLLTVEEALNSIKTDLKVWKPNCALVMIDFALRHGFLDPDHPVSFTTSSSAEAECLRRFAYTEMFVNLRHDSFGYRVTA